MANKQKQANTNHEKGMLQSVSLRSNTIRLAEKLAQYLCSLMRLAESMATPETQCLLYATYWFRPIPSELIGAAKESSEVNRDRAPSSPVKVVVTNRPHLLGRTTFGSPNSIYLSNPKNGHQTNRTVP